jgi:uncharacterized radical SAM superfamily Fe-S cluster-containing enzyme
MARVTIVFPPLLVSRDFIDYPFFADLGAVQAAAVLRDAGHEVALVDAFARPFAGLVAEAREHVRLGVDVPALLAALPADADVLLVAYTPFHRPPSRDATLGALLAALRARAPGTPILLADLYQSGQHVVDVASAQILAAYPEVDAILRYEAEAELAALVGELAVGGRPATPFERRGVEPPLDALPLPAWDLVDLPAYWAFHESVMGGLGRAAWAFPIDRRSLPMLSSRGCPFRCAHCSSNPGRTPGQPKTQRRHSPAYLARALDDLAARGARRVHLLDELANVHESHFDALLAALDARGLAFEIPNGLRADYLLPKHLAAMRGRLTTLSVSAESGDARVVNEVVDKQLDLGAIRAAAANAQAAGIPLLVHFMIGLPGETHADVNRTLALACELHERSGVWPSVQFATPLPGTRLAEIAARRGRVLPMVEDWGPHFQKSPTIATDDFSLAGLQSFKRAFDRRMEAAREPAPVILDVTYRCNNRCAFCTTGTRAQRDGDPAAHEALLVEHRRRGATALELEGGEPTLAPHLFPLIRRARQLGYRRVALTTNGRLASYPSFGRALARSGATSIDFSIHGPTATLHGEHVGVDDAFEQVLAGARNVAREAGPGLELGMTTTLTRANLPHLPALAALACELGFTGWNLRFVTPFGRGTRALTPEAAAAGRAIAGVLDAFGARLAVRVFDLPFCFLPDHVERVVVDPLSRDASGTRAGRAEIASEEPERRRAWLLERRAKTAACDACVHAIACDGFTAVDDAPEPTWLLPIAGVP